MISPVSGQVTKSRSKIAASISLRSTCLWCSGTGKCPQCGGSRRDPSALLVRGLSYACPVCDGNGRVSKALIAEMCVHCGGKGVVSKSRCVCQKGICPACDGKGWLYDTIIAASGEGQVGGSTLRTQDHRIPKDSEAVLQSLRQRCLIAL